MDLWGPLLGVIVFASSVAVPVVAIWIFRKSKNPSIRGPALTGTAQVLSVQTTGMTVNDSYVLQIALRVQVPDRPPYDATVSRRIHPIQMAAIQPGRIIPVRVDATDPNVIEFDFNRSAQSPQTLASRAMTAAQLADAVKRAPGAGSVGSAADLLASGQRVRAVLKSFAPTGTTPRSLGRTPSRPELLDAPHYIVEVELHFPNLAPLTGRNQQTVPVEQVPTLSIGRELVCAVDPGDPTNRFVIDWDSTP
ncbi:hypothetical protein [Mycobacterium conspicuum]|uniref:Uncharacterized protein n=1 Tax=Mycobacterium conspicuum TaxID=44010 RepID=A0A1X1TCK3_9MYCO|nr:hypothetical protein [Mycobacterium conspicuum]ORV42313.1 hypothetical protein AWC00_12530 [Mycobacterium conspicuum]BBZ40048.1 hypothetical protein MCNS_31110 [Mycobacterium conspicuum]